MTYPASLQAVIIDAVDCSRGIPVRVGVGVDGKLDQVIPLPVPMRRGMCGLAEVIASPTLILMLAQTYDDVIAAIKKANTFNEYFAEPKLAGETADEVRSMVESYADKARQEIKDKETLDAERAAAELLSQMTAHPVNHGEIAGGDGLAGPHDMAQRVSPHHLAGA